MSAGSLAEPFPNRLADDARRFLDDRLARFVAVNCRRSRWAGPCSCVWCGGPVQADRSHAGFCSPGCRDDAGLWHRWKSARAAALEAAAGGCLRCTAVAATVHHVEPMGGRKYSTLSCLHHPVNLVPLCDRCHKAEHGTGRR